MGSVYNNPDTGAVFVEDTGGRLVWSTERAPVNLLPESDWIVLTGYSISFPDFTKGFYYQYHRAVTAPPILPSGQDLDFCRTIATIAPSETTLADLNIGTVPAGCNYIDVRVNLTRTKNPDNYLGLPVPSLLPSQEVPLPGGSALVERCGAWRRMFDVRLSGTSVLLRRRQSSISVPSNQLPSFTSNYTANAWSAGGSTNASPAALIQVKGGFNATNERRRGGSDACSTSTSGVNFSSTYTGTITIRPGYIKL